MTRTATAVVFRLQGSTQRLGKGTGAPSAYAAQRGELAGSSSFAIAWTAV